jgi:hypothetical protein
VGIHDESSEPHLPALAQRQLDVWRALRAKAKDKLPFHDWYRGAIAALDASSQLNPDRLTQAANGLREILEKLPRALNTEVPRADRNILQQARSSMVAAVVSAKNDYQSGWNGEITPNLASALREVDQYIALRKSPTRAETTFEGLAKLDPMIAALPDEARQRKLRRYKDVSKRLENFTHHRCPPDDREFEACLVAAEDLLLDLVAPITADDQGEISALIAKGASLSTEDFRRAFSLIDRRGANFAFFFSNVADPIWLNPLRSAGYLRSASPIVDAGDGFVSFPFWWPMSFLKRIAAQAPDTIVEILVNLDHHNNPRVLDGIVEIAADLPVDMSLRLEPLVEDYIRLPYHV